MWTRGGGEAKDPSCLCNREGSDLVKSGKKGPEFYSLHLIHITSTQEGWGGSKLSISWRKRNKSKWTQGQTKNQNKDQRKGAQLLWEWTVKCYCSSSNFYFIPLSLWQEPIFYVRLAWRAAEKNRLLFRFGDDEQKYPPGRHFPDTLCGKKKKGAKSFWWFCYKSSDTRIPNWLESKVIAPGEPINMYAWVLNSYNWWLVIAQRWQHW